jgi:hypothetical protein
MFFRNRRLCGKQPKYAIEEATSVDVRERDQEDTSIDEKLPLQLQSASINFATYLSWILRL